VSLTIIGRRAAVNHGAARGLARRAQQVASLNLAAVNGGPESAVRVRRSRRRPESHWSRGQVLRRAAPWWTLRAAIAIMRRPHRATTAAPDAATRPAGVPRAREAIP